MSSKIVDNGYGPVYRDDLRRRHGRLVYSFDGRSFGDLELYALRPG